MDITPGGSRHESLLRGAVYPRTLPFPTGPGTRGPGSGFSRSRFVWVHIYMPGRAARIPGPGPRGGGRGAGRSASHSFSVLRGFICGRQSQQLERQGRVHHIANRLERGIDGTLSRYDTKALYSEHDHQRRVLMDT